MKGFGRTKFGRVYQHLYHVKIANMSVLSILVKHRKFWRSLSFVDMKDCVIYVMDLIIAFPFPRVEFLYWQSGIDLPFLFILIISVFSKESFVLFQVQRATGPKTT